MVSDAHSHRDCVPYDPRVPYYWRHGVSRNPVRQACRECSAGERSLPSHRNSVDVRTVVVVSASRCRTMHVLVHAQKNCYRRVCTAVRRHPIFYITTREHPIPEPIQRYCSRCTHRDRTPKTLRNRVTPCRPTAGPNAGIWLPAR